MNNSGKGYHYSGERFTKRMFWIWWYYINVPYDQKVSMPGYRKFKTKRRERMIQKRRKNEHQRKAAATT